MSFRSLGKVRLSLGKEAGCPSLLHNPINCADKKVDQITQKLFVTAGSFFCGSLIKLKRRSVYVKLLF